MRIAFSGTANTGKSTLLRDFLTVWQMYTTPEETYRDVIKRSKLTHSKGATKEGQEEILNFIVNSMKGKTPEDNIAYDRCALDNVVYSMWAYDKGIGGIDEAFISKCIATVRESIKDLDIIFWVPYNENIRIQNDDLRETDLDFIKEIDNIFAVIYNQYILGGNFPLFDREDMPAIIPVLATERHNRLVEIANYVNLDGNSINPDEQWINEYIKTADQDSGAKESVETLLKQQKEEAFARDGTIIV